MNKKMIIAILALTISLSSIVQADGTAINDLDKSSSYAKSAIQYLADQKVISGDQNGNFNPQKLVTRAEMVALMAKAMNLDTTKVPEIATFSDVPTDSWMFKYVEAAYSQGIITGVNATEFKPNDKITREQMAVIFVRALKLVDKDTTIDLNNINAFSDKAKISSWAQKEVEVAIEAGLMNGVSANVFEPKTAANKEQSAVVIERLMKNKEAIINRFKEQILDEAKVKTTLNHEAIVLKDSIIVQEGKIFVPIEFINKYILDATVYDIEQDAETFAVYPAPEIARKGLEVLWMQVGSTKAYKNLEEDPFASADIPAENTIDLTIAPIKIEGKTYISVDVLVYYLEADYQYLSEINQVNIFTATARNNVNFYFALKQLVYNDFVGEMKSQGELKLMDKKTQQYYRETYDMTDKQNDNYTVWSYSKETVEVSGEKPVVTEYQSMTIDKKHYQKDFSDNKWTQKNLKTGLTNIYTIFYNPIFENEEVKDYEMSARLFENYNRIDIKKEGTANISGVPATKYVIEYDADSISNIMTDEEYQVVKEFANVNFQGKLNYRHEFYISNNTVIKQTFLFDGNMIDPDTGNDVNYHSTSTIYYKNLGKKSIITAPPASQIKAVIQ